MHGSSGACRQRGRGEHRGGSRARAGGGRQAMTGKTGAEARLQRASYGGLEVWLYLVGNREPSKSFRGEG